ncbi:unnamed protein product, partial [Rotaria magnacalcarata]
MSSFFWSPLTLPSSHHLSSIFTEPQAPRLEMMKAFVNGPIIEQKE